jgi:uncharacterized membrane protein
MPLGWLLCAVQIMSARNDMFSNVFEIVIATIISFIAAALASTRVFCYTALVSGGVVLILPGYIVLTGALELASRNITAGAVRIGYSTSESDYQMISSWIELIVRCYLLALPRLRYLDRSRDLPYHHWSHCLWS